MRLSGPALLTSVQPSCPIRRLTSWRMMLITAAIALPFAYSLQHFVRLNRGLAMASGFVSVAFGLFLCYQIGFVDGLFTGHVHWNAK